MRSRFRYTDGMSGQSQSVSKSGKQDALELVRSLPDDATMDDILYELEVVRRGKDGQNPEEDEAMSREEVVASLKRRIMLTGQP